jgi:hypothetical protein
LLALFLTLPHTSNAAPPEYRILSSSRISRVWPGHPVGFALLTHGPDQYVAFYDAERNMTVAHRRLDEDRWTTRTLPSKVGWDSHNSLTMAIDEAGQLHLAGNMHVNPLVYFRTRTPGDVTTFERIASMTGDREERCTYPRFIEGPNGQLTFMYRDGGSGNGRRIFNRYDASTQTWRRPIDQPLLEGGGRMNAYPNGPIKGPDGAYHMIWMWRDTPDCSTNHDISYATSPDLVHWRDAAGTTVTLPITPETPGVVIDPVPAKLGLINMGFNIGFDDRERAVISYHKYAADGKSQIHNARWEDGRWAIRQVSNWDERWDFSGGGSIPCLVEGGPVRPTADGTLRFPWRQWKVGSGVWRLDSQTMAIVGEGEPSPVWPREMRKVRSGFDGMIVQQAADSGSAGMAGEHYVLRWETLERNRDRPRTGPLPEADWLEVYRLASPVDENGDRSAARPSVTRGNRYPSTTGSRASGARRRHRGRRPDRGRF